MHVFIYSCLRLINSSAHPCHSNKHVRPRPRRMDRALLHFQAKRRSPCASDMRSLGLFRVRRAHENDSTAQGRAGHRTAQRSTQRSAALHTARTAQRSTVHHSTAQRSTAHCQHSTAHCDSQHSTSQHSTHKHSRAQELKEAQRTCTLVVQCAERC